MRLHLNASCHRPPARRWGARSQHVWLHRQQTTQGGRTRSGGCYTSSRGSRAPLLSLRAGPWAAFPAAAEATEPSIAANINQEAGSPTVDLLSERGVPFTLGSAFYRPESAQARDLAVLAAAVHARRKGGQLRVLDVMSGCGVRGARYIQQAGATEVWCNDYNPSNSAALVANVCGAASGSGPADWLGQQSQQEHQTVDHEQPPAQQQGGTGQGTHAAMADDGGSLASTSAVLGHEESFLPGGLKRAVRQWRFPQLSSSPQQGQGMQGEAGSEGVEGSVTGLSGGGQEGQVRVRVSHVDAHRLLSCVALNEDYYDLVDVDSFGSETSFLGAALETVRYGGLLYLTSTDGFCSAGHRPERSLAAYGAYLRAMPFSNEQGLRMLIGAAVKEGAARGMVVTPLFSLYSYHGPVFRVMLRVTRSAEWHHEHYGFVGHCHVHGDTRVVGWRQLGNAYCSCCMLPEKGRPNRHAPPTPSSPMDAGTTTSSQGPLDGADPEEGEARGKGPRGPQGPPLALSGPMWTGPLHCPEALREMREEATRRGWLGHDLPTVNPYAGSSKPSAQASPGTMVPEASGTELSSNAAPGGSSSSGDASGVDGSASSGDDRTGKESCASSSAPSSQDTQLSQLASGGGLPSSGPRAKSKGRSGVEAGPAPSRGAVLVRSKKNGPMALGQLLEVMEDEADPRLGPGYLKLDTIALHLACHPSRDKVIAELRARGFAASRCHLDARALRTDASMLQVLRACHLGLGIKLRAGSPFQQLM